MAARARTARIWSCRSSATSPDRRRFAASASISSSAARRCRRSISRMSSSICFAARATPSGSISNVETLPVDSNSTFIRSVPPDNGGLGGTFTFMSGGGSAITSNSYISVSVRDSAGVNVVRTTTDSAGTLVTKADDRLESHARGPRRSSCSGHSGRARTVCFARERTARIVLPRATRRCSVAPRSVRTRRSASGARDRWSSKCGDVGVGPCVDSRVARGVQRRQAAIVSAGDRDDEDRRMEVGGDGGRGKREGEEGRCPSSPIPIPRSPCPTIQIPRFARDDKILTSARTDSRPCSRHIARRPRPPARRRTTRA